MAIDGINIPFLGTTIINAIGVTQLAITGQTPISGNIAFIPSGQVQMAYSGNNIIIGVTPRSIAELYTSGNAALNGITTIGQYVNISGLSRTGIMQDFTMSNSGQVTYQGAVPVGACFVGVNGRCFTAGGTKLLTFSVAKNGAVIPTVAIQNPTTAGNGTQFSFITTAALISGDSLRLVLANLSDTTDVTVPEYNFIVRS